MKHISLTPRLSRFIDSKLIALSSESEVIKFYARIGELNDYIVKETEKAILIHSDFHMLRVEHNKPIFDGKDVGDKITSVFGLEYEIVRVAPDRQAFIIGERGDVDLWIPKSVLE